MRLKSIKLAGFKSFVDPTTVSFPGDLSAVVGPNGCGKSNIIDAVRWVMGESSAKHLRGESMADVIFNGSGGRKPVGQASVELIFDNGDGSLGGEYAQYSEISIKRNVARDGQSNYYLNGNKCRRRDITDIFLGTGLGPRSYAIIEQGMISSLIEAKPEELRVYIEEAAGISKYKDRRRDTETRIQRTQENLERLTDIREELHRQIQRLERQAKAAEKYTQLKKEERLLKAQLEALRWKSLHARRSGHVKIIKEFELVVESLIADRGRCDTGLEKLRVEHTELNDQFNGIQGRYYGIGAEVARLEQAIKGARDRAAELRRDIEQTERNFAESETHLVTDRQKATGWEAELAEITPELEKVRVAEKSSSANLRDGEQAMNNWQAEWDEFNQLAARPVQQVEVQQSHIQHLEQVLNRLEERIENLQSEHEELASSPMERDIAGLQQQFSQSENRVRDYDASLTELTNKIDVARREQHVQSETLNALRSELQALTGRQASLEALQQAALQDATGEQQDWLIASQLQDRPRLAENLNVVQGWETALETVLGSYLQAICTDTVEIMAPHLSGFTKGELIALEPRPGKSDAARENSAFGQAALLIDKVAEKDLLEPLLAGVYVVETTDDAFVMKSQLGDSESVVTKGGVWLGPNWLRVARDKDAGAGILKRRQELEDLANSIAVTRHNLAEQEMREAENRGHLVELEREREVVRGQLGESQKASSELQSRLSARQAQIEQFTARRTRIESELAETRRQIGIEQENMAEARRQLTRALEAMEGDASRREQLLQRRDATRSRLDSARHSARHDRDRLHELAMREQSVCTQLNSIREGIARLEVQVTRLRERRQQLENAFNENDQPMDELQRELDGKLANRLEVEKELGQSRRALEAVEFRMREIEQQRIELEQKIQEQRSTLENERLLAQDLATRTSTIEEQIDRHGFALDQLLSEMPEDASENEWGNRVERMGNRIQRLGPINLAAADEFKTETERKTYLDAQNEDLVEALQTLENAIRKIDRETRTRFRETFEAINTSLQELFPKLFDGGHAYLELTGDDLLDTGVTIMARPPGKKNTNIKLLSGGEKAMTAIALVFSIFRLNPAPFCMLDEVDAPLDDANVVRYARLVREMSEQVQFVYITHNKISMEMASHLMGVTMHEPGVSRLVSVDINQAAELAEAS